MRWTWEGRKMKGYFAARFRKFTPRGINLLVCNIPCDQVIEVFQATADRWEARSRPYSAGSKSKTQPIKEVRTTSVEQAFEVVERLYTESEGWTLFDESGLVIEPDEPALEEQRRAFESSTRKKG